MVEPLMCKLNQARINNQTVKARQQAAFNMETVEAEPQFSSSPAQPQLHRTQI